jgi:hypothetical protein
MSFLKRASASKADAPSALAGPHRVRIQMANCSFPVATFELPCNVYTTSISDVLTVAGNNLKSQAAASGVMLDGGLYCNVDKFAFERPTGSSSFMNVSQVPKITNLGQSLSAAGLASGGTLYVISSSDIDALLMTPTQRYDGLPPA